MTDQSFGAALSRLLIDDWHRVMRRAWSIRLMAISIALDGLEVTINVMTSLQVEPPIAPGWFAAFAGVTTVAAGAARFIAQRKD
jgi:hypothetical protein